MKPWISRSRASPHGDCAKHHALEESLEGGGYWWGPHLRDDPRTFYWQTARPRLDFWKWNDSFCICKMGLMMLSFKTVRKVKYRNRYTICSPKYIPRPVQPQMANRYWSMQPFFFFSKLLVQKPWAPFSAKTHFSGEIYLIKEKAASKVMRAICSPVQLVGCILITQDAVCRELLPRVNPVGLFFSTHIAEESTCIPHITAHLGSYLVPIDLSQKFFHCRTRPQNDSQGQRPGRIFPSETYRYNQGRMRCDMPAVES